MSYLTFTVEAGDNIERVARSAVELATSTKLDVRFEFNGITVCVEPDCFSADVGKRYNEALEAKGIFVRVRPRSIA